MNKTPYITKMSSRGQVVIPETLRKTLGFEEGTPFLVIGRGDTIVLQRLKEPPWKFFDDITKEAARDGQNHDEAMRGYAKVFKRLREGR